MGDKNQILGKTRNSTCRWVLLKITIKIGQARKPVRGQIAQLEILCENCHFYSQKRILRDRPFCNFCTFLQVGRNSIQFPPIPVVYVCAQAHARTSISFPQIHQLKVRSRTDLSLTQQLIYTFSSSTSQREHRIFAFCSDYLHSSRPLCA